MLFDYVCVLPKPHVAEELDAFLSAFADTVAFESEQGFKPEL
jgi:hypothetical protein